MSYITPPLDYIVELSPDSTPTRTTVERAIHSANDKEAVVFGILADDPLNVVYRFDTDPPGTLRMCHYSWFRRLPGPPVVRLKDEGFLGKV